MRYFVIKEAPDETHVYISDIPAGLTRKYELLRGVSRKAGWPSDLAVSFSKHRAEGMVLTDAIENAFGWLVASDRLKRLIEDAGAVDVEYLPVQVKNHKGRIASTEYWILNFPTLVEAVDRAQSKFDVDAVNPALIFSFDKLVVRDSILDHGPVIFRLAERPRLMLVREDLAERIQQAQMTGIRLVEAGQFKSYAPPVS